MATPIVYLVHFDEKYKHAQHYIGYTCYLSQRMEHHRRGRGSRLLGVVASAGINYDVVRTWEGDKQLERRLKNRKKAWTLCPVCNPKVKAETNQQVIR